MGGSEAHPDAGVIEATLESRASIRGHPDELSHDARQFLQRRIARLSMILGTISLTFLLVRAIGGFLAEAVALELLHVSFPLHTAACGVLLATWLVLSRRRVLSGRAIYAADLISIVGSSLLYIGMGFYLPMALRPDIMLLLILSYSLLGRSIYVPSAWQRTLGFGALIALGFVAMTVSANRQGDTSLSDLIASLFGLQVDPRHMGLGLTVFVQAWWWTTVFLAVSASQVIYGLRREVSAARQLGQYELTRKLGEGGMGEVYEARHLLLRRATAVKLLRPELAGEQSIRRFEREVRATAKLTHPNTVTIFDFGRAANGVFYYAMELLEGGSLADIVQLAGPMDPERVLHVLHQVADALTEAHEKGLVHRDIKPGNIMLTCRGGVPDVAKVVDFGLVKESKGADVSLTGDNSLLGTPLYLAPEAIRHADGYEPRSDLYALGGVAYFMLTGEHVFEASTTMELLSLHLMEPPPSPSRQRGGPLPDGLEALILDLLAKDPADRPADAGVVMARIEACGAFGEWTRRRAARWWHDFGPELAEGHPLEAPTVPTMQIALSNRR